MDSLCLGETKMVLSGDFRDNVGDFRNGSHEGKH